MSKEQILERLIKITEEVDVDIESSNNSMAWALGALEAKLGHLISDLEEEKK